MGKRRTSEAAERSWESRQVSVYRSAHQLAELSELMLLSGAPSPALLDEIRNLARALLLLTDMKADARRLEGANVIDLHRRFRLRAVMAALSATPEPPPPRRA